MRVAGASSQGRRGLGGPPHAALHEEPAALQRDRGRGVVRLQGARGSALVAGGVSSDRRQGERAIGPAVDRGRIDDGRGHLVVGASVGIEVGVEEHARRRFRVIGGANAHGDGAAHEGSFLDSLPDDRRRDAIGGLQAGAPEELWIGVAPQGLEERARVFCTQLGAIPVGGKLPRADELPRGSDQRAAPEVGVDVTASSTGAELAACGRGRAARIYRRAGAHLQAAAGRGVVAIVAVEERILAQILHRGVQQGEQVHRLRGGAAGRAKVIGQDGEPAEEKGRPDLIGGAGRWLAQICRDDALPLQGAEVSIEDAIGVADRAGGVAYLSQPRTELRFDQGMNGRNEERLLRQDGEQVQRAQLGGGIELDRLTRDQVSVRSSQRADLQQARGHAGRDGREVALLVGSGAAELVVDGSSPVVEIELFDPDLRVGEADSGRDQNPAVEVTAALRRERQIDAGERAQKERRPQEHDESRSTSRCLLVMRALALPVGHEIFIA